MQKFAPFMLMAFANPALGQSATFDQEAIYESSDGRSVLMVSGSYYYLGPRNHPETSDFVKQYGQMLEYRSMNGGKCLSLGVFKVAVIQGMTSVCQNVHIKRLPRPGSRNVNYYVAMCFELKGGECSSTKGRGRPALVYEYKVENGRGITEIYLSDRRSRNASNTFILKFGSALLR
jgi:hypothetical protein